MSFDGLAADDPTHGGITSETAGIVDIVISAKASKDGLADLPDHAMPPILTSTAVLKKLAGNVRQAKGMVKLPVGEKSGVEPWNSSFRRRSKSTRKWGVLESPVG